MDKSKGFQKYLSLLGIHAKLDFLWLIRDTRYALIVILGESVSTVSAFGSIYLLAVNFGENAGINPDEVLFMLGYLAILNGILQAFTCSNNLHVSRIIGRGQLEHLLIQPHSIKTQLLTMGYFPFTGGSLNLLMGIAITGIALHRLEIAPTPWWILSVIANILISILILTSLSYLFSSLAFYSPVAAEEISSYVVDLGMDLGKYPLSNMPVGVQIPLITLFPSGLLAWFPSQMLLGKPPLDLPFAFILLVASVFFLLAKFFFRKGMNYYVRYGSNRYLPYGFRN